MFISAAGVLLLLTLISAVFAFRLFNAPAIGSANIIFYFLLGLFLITVVVGLGQQYFGTNQQSTIPVQQGGH